MKRYDEDNDTRELNRYPEKERDEMIVLAVTRNKEKNVLHWRIAWQATAQDSDEIVGFKVLEVKHDRNDRSSTGGSQEFLFRFSLRGSASESAKDWFKYDLGYLRKDYRDILVTVAEDWDFKGEGNCITCVRETIENLVDIGAFGEGEEARNVLRQLLLARQEDLSLGVQLFGELHNQADNALAAKRAVPTYVNGVLKAHKSLLM